MNIDKERELFEEYVTLNFPGHSVERFGSLYVHIETEDMWRIWMARAAIAPEWISVESGEHIPTQTELLCKLRQGGIVIALYWPTEDYHDTEVWWDEHEIHSWDFEDVTHWQPLPQVKG